MGPCRMKNIPILATPTIWYDRYVSHLRTGIVKVHFHVVEVPATKNLKNLLKYGKTQSTDAILVYLNEDFTFLHFKSWR